jgi:predicted NAD-dependent protein-ADP-ribosyltransferase YbiA (DUF1768 family)
MANSPLRPTGVQDADFFPVGRTGSRGQDAFTQRHALEGDFKRGLRTGGVQSSVGALNREALAAELEGDTATMQARRQRAQDLQRESEAFAPPVTSLRDIDSIDSAQDFAEGAIGQGMASMVTPMAGSVAGSLLLRKPVGALAGSAVPSFQMVKGETVTGQYDDPTLSQISSEERNRVANISSTAGAAMESIVPAGVGRILTRPAAQAARRSGVRETGMAALTEGLTETAQTGVQFAGEKYLDPDRTLDPWDMADAFAAGALTGGTVTGGATGARAAFDSARPMAQQGLERVAGRVTAARDRLAAARDTASRQPVPLVEAAAAERINEERNRVTQAREAGQDPMAAIFTDEDSETAVALSTAEGRARLIDTAVRAFPEDPTAQVEAVKQAMATASQRLRDRLLQNPAVAPETRARLSDITNFSDPQAHATIVEAHSQVQTQENNQTVFQRMAAAAQRLTGRRSDFGGDRTTGEQPTARDVGRMRWVRQAMLRAAANKDAQAKTNKEAKRGAQIDERDAAQDQVDRVRVATKQALLASLPKGMAVDKDTQAFISDTADTLLTMAARTTVPKGMIEPIEDAWQRFNEMYGEQAPKIAQTIMKQVPQDETQRSIMAQLVEGSKPAVAEFAAEGSVFNRNLTSQARNMSPQALRKLARLVDDFASMDTGRDTDVLMPMFDAAFGGRERALAVLDHYASPLRETARPDTGAAESDIQADMEEGDAVDTFSDNLTAVDGPQRTYVLQEGTQGRPFLANSTEMTEQLNKMVATGVFNEASVTPIPFSDYVYDQVGETLQDAEREAKRIYKDVRKRLQKNLDELTAKIRKEIEANPNPTPEQEKLWQDTSTSGKQTSEMATKRRNMIRKALNDGVVDFPKDGGEYLRANYLSLQQQMQEFAGRYRAGGPVHALDMYQVLAVEGGADSVVATAEELQAWGKKPKPADTRQLEGDAKRIKIEENKTLPRMAIKFNRDKGNPITIYVPSIIAEAHGRRDPGDFEGVLDFNRSVVMEAIAKVLATPGITGIQTDLGGIVMGRQGGLDLTNTLLTPGQIMQLLEPAPTPAPEKRAKKPPAFRKAMNAVEKSGFRKELNERVAEMVKVEGSGFDPEVGAVSLYMQAIALYAGKASEEGASLVDKAKVTVARDALNNYLNLVFPLPPEAQFDANLILEEGGESVADIFRGNTQEQQSLQAKEAELAVMRDRLAVMEQAFSVAGAVGAVGTLDNMITRLTERVQKLEVDVANQDKRLAASDERKGIRTGARDVAEGNRARTEREVQKAKEAGLDEREARLEAEQKTTEAPKPMKKSTAPKTAKQAQREQLAQDAKAFKGKVTKGDDDTSKAQTDAKKTKLLSPAEALRKRGKDLRTAEQKASMTARQEKLDREKAATTDAEKRFSEMVTKWDDDRLARFKGPGEMQNRVVEAERTRRYKKAVNKMEAERDRADHEEWVAGIDRKPSVSRERTQSEPKPAPSNKYVLKETFEVDDDYGNPTSEVRKTFFDTKAEAEAAAAKSDADFGARVSPIERPTTTNVWWGSAENQDLSNLADRPFTYKGEKYRSVEHAYQTWKGGKFDAITHNAYKRSAEGEKIRNRNVKAKTEDGWNLKLMQALVDASFDANPAAQKTLLETGDTTITHTQDRGVWGTEFPKILMKTRERLAKQPESAKPPAIEARAQKIIDRIDARTEWTGEQANAALDMIAAILPDLGGKKELAAQLEKRVQTLKDQLDELLNGAPIESGDSLSPQERQSRLYWLYIRNQELGQLEDRIARAEDNKKDATGFKAEHAELKEDLAAFKRENPWIAAEYGAFVDKITGQRSGNNILSAAQENQMQKITKELRERLPTMTTAEVEKYISKQQWRRNKLGPVEYSLNKQEQTLASVMEYEISLAKQELESRGEVKKGLRNSLVRPLEANELSQKDRDDIIAQVAKMRGKKVTVEFVKALEIGGASGTWTSDRLIRIATTASNPMSVAYHEAMHDFFSMLGGSKEERALKEKLLKVSGRPAIMFKMVSLLKNHPEALKALNTDPEERLAYMFQLWQMGKLDLAGESQSFFGRVAQAIRNLLGTVSEMKQAEALFNALADGKFAEPSTVAKVAMDVSPGQTMGDKAAFLLEPIRRIAHDVAIKVPTDRLRDTGIKALADLADRFEPVVGQGGMGMLQSRIQKTDQFLNKMGTIFEGTTASERQAAIRNLQAMKDPSSPLEQRLVGLLDELFKYMKESGVQTMRQQPAYEVRLEMAASLSSRAALQKALAGMKLKGAPKDPAGNAKFILQKVARGELTPDQLPGSMAQSVAKKIAEAGPGEKSWVPIAKAKKYFPRVWDPTVIADKREEFLKTFSKYMPEQEAEQTYLALVNGHHSPDLTENEHHLGFTPFAEALIGRKFEFINETNAHEFVQFQQADAIEILSTYIQQAAHRGEYAKTFGNQGEVIEQAMSAAEQAGATPEEIATARKSVLALEGTLGHQFDPRLRALQTKIITYQNILLLPVSLFSQFVDSLGVGLRTGDIRESFTSFKNGMRDIARAVSRSDKKDEAQEMARLIGIISAENMLANMGQVYSGMYMSRGVKEVNRLFFKFNGMELWNRSVRTSAMMAGHRFIIRNKDNARYMKELGVEPADVFEIEGGRLAVFKAEIDQELAKSRPELTAAQREAEAARIEQVMHQALFKFVDSAVVRPRASHRPVWMSDPRFMLVAHLKQFAFSFQHTYLSRVKHEFDHGNLTPALHLAFFVPFMLAADTARFILTGTGPRYENMDAYSMFVTAVARAGVLGVGEFGLAVEQDLSKGRIPNLLGPTADHLLTLGNTALGAGSVERAADRTIPFLKVLGSISGRITGG